ncbi:Hypothetical protein UVM_LOCUS197 [uncultured virus]|nr:Hypothetical protein UVM_LOCUS197 [uncultured virus]
MSERESKQARRPYACGSFADGRLTCATTDRFLDDVNARRVRDLEYDTLEECERDCNLWEGLPIELREYALAYLPRVEQRAQLASVSTADRELMLQHLDPCQYLRREQPGTWRRFAGEGEHVDAARCARFGVQCDPNPGSEADVRNCRTVAGLREPKAEDIFLIDRSDFEDSRYGLRRRTLTSAVKLDNAEFYDPMQGVFRFVLRRFGLRGPYRLALLNSFPVLHEGQAFRLLSADFVGTTAPISFESAEVSPHFGNGLVTVIVRGHGLVVEGLLALKDQNRAKSDDHFRTMWIYWLLRGSDGADLWKDSPEHRLEFEESVRQFLHHYGLPMQYVVLQNETYVLVDVN